MSGGQEFEFQEIEIQLFHEIEILFIKLYDVSIS